MISMRIIQNKEDASCACFMKQLPKKVAMNL
ncbi:hypothetical protein FHT67_005360 [Paenibacillus sp. BK720]|nr:hypothetical protein [Paenibacillus sp. BK720]